MAAVVLCRMLACVCMPSCCVACLHVFAWLPSCCVACCMGLHGRRAVLHACMCLHGCRRAVLYAACVCMPSCCAAVYCRAIAALMLHYCWAVVRWAWLAYVPYCSMDHRRAAHRRSRPHLSRRKCRGTPRQPHSSRSKDCTPCPSSDSLPRAAQFAHCCPRTAVLCSSAVHRAGAVRFCAGRPAARLSRVQHTLETPR